MKQGILIGLITLFSTGLAQAAEALKVGDKLPNITLTTQHDKAFSFDNGVKRIIMSVEKQSADMLTNLLDSKPASYLKDTQTIYLADIHRMPSLITKFVALPQLREKTYDIVLGREEADLATFPREKGCLTLMSIKEQTIESLRFICNEDELKTTMNP
ncbi:MAG: hypothetical protein IE928_01730 [Gammaproteobacteria bacterium]|nr:hypothetical protein [Gammaproteobacteria bacterium]